MTDKQSRHHGHLIVTQKGTIARNQKGDKRNLMLIDEKGTGSTILIIPTTAFISGEQLRVLENSDLEAEYIVQARKISVHPTLHKPDVNDIHETVSYREGESKSSYHQTKALKIDNKFALVTAKFCQAMIDPPSDQRPVKGDDISIGSYDCDHFTLIYALFVGNIDRRFKLDHAHLDLNIMEFQTDKFNFVLIWSYLSIPAYHAGVPIQVDTWIMKDEDNVNVHEPTKGMDEIECLSDFRKMRIDATLRIVEIVTNDKRISPADAEIVFKSAAFYRCGRGEGDARYVIGKTYRKTVDNSLFLALKNFKDTHP